MSIEHPDDLAGLGAAGRVVAITLREVRRLVRPGVTTAELDRAAARVLARHGARSAPRLTYGFPGSICISVGDEVVHGVPGARRLRAGELVKIDVTAELDGYYADAAISVLPTVPNHADPAASRPLTEGLVLAVEPMIAAGGGQVELLADGWTIATRDGSVAAHVEHTVVIRTGPPLVLTA